MAMKMGPIAVFLIIGVLIAGGVVGVMYVTQTAGPEATTTAKITTNDCATDPALSVSAVNALKKGTAVTVGTNARVNGAYVGAVPSALQLGDKVELILNASNFLDTTVSEFEVSKCGTQTISAELYATSTNTFRMFNTDGDALTDNVAGGATNQSASAAPISIDVKIDSTSKESTGDLIVVVEADNTTQVDSIVLSGSGATDTSTPSFYTLNAAGSIVKAFKVPAVLDGASVPLTLTLSPESGQTITGTGVYVTAYSEQAFVDTDGSFKVGVEDSDGTTKYEDTWDFDFYVQ